MITSASLEPSPEEMLNVAGHGSHQMSRRRAMTNTAGLAAMIPGVSLAKQADARREQRVRLAYVGTYSSPQGPEGSKGNGRGIYLFEMNPSTGALKEREVFEDDSNPSCLALHPSKKYLFSANEISNYNGGHSGSVSAFSVDLASGHLTKLNTVSSGGAGPAHLSVHPSGKYVLVANYAGGSFAVLPVLADGRLGTPASVKHDEGQVGPKRAQSAPTRSFAISGHDAPHAHMIEADPSGRFIVVSDLGLDQIQIWKLDEANGSVTPNTTVSVPPGDGPRHFVFHPNHKWFYSLQEEGSTVILFDYDMATGRLTARQTVSSLPPGYAGTNFTSEIRLSADGRFLYAGNRLHDSIAVFSISKTGTLKFQSETWTRGDYPRSFTIDPAGNFLYSCNQRSDVVTVFRVNREYGNLTFTDLYTPVGTPSIFVFLD